MKPTRSPGAFLLRVCVVLLAAQLAAASEGGRERLSLDANWKFHPGDIPLDSFPGGQGIVLYGPDFTHRGGNGDPNGHEPENGK